MNLPARLVLLGYPVSHSLSPTFQNAALASAGLQLRYEPLAVPPNELDAVLATLLNERAAGNVTVPHKEAVFRACTQRTHVADRAGAVNTFWCEDGALRGDNTDVGGFARAVGELCDGARPRSIALVGAGGAAAAVCVAAEDWGAREVRVAARNAARARALADRFPGLVRVYADVDVALAGAELVVNATPLGLDHADPFPTAPEQIPADASVLDLVYRRDETRWVRAARSAGRRAADGLTMLIEQGALSFECWFGVPPDRDAMRRAVRELTGRER
ncbi:MAG TPA: hypothetical protein VHM30_06215 [Gemmatimonadaceae bacterium]|nr:hypothetical protein [Gemmatimonadaceae bacterium]